MLATDLLEILVRIELFGRGRLGAVVPLLDELGRLVELLLEVVASTIAA